MLIQAVPTRRVSRANLSGLGASATVSYAQKGASAGASVGSVVPVLGTTVGAVVGAVLGAIGGAFIGSRRPESDLWDQYKKIAGTARGIELDPAFRAGAFVGLFRLGKNTFPPRAKGGYGPRDDARFLNDMAAQIAAAVRAGQVTAADNAQSVFSKVVGPWISQWGTEPNADWRRWENQIVTDLIDAYLYDLPIIATSYTTQGWAQPRLSDVVKSMQPAPTPTPAPAPPAPVAPAAPVVKLPTPVTPAPAAPAPSVPVPPPATPSVTVPPAPATNLTPQVADNTRALIDALLAQGQSSQSTFAAAMQSLAAAGVQPTPQIQQAVAEEVKTQQSSPIPWPWILGGSGVAVVLAALALRRRRAR